uniref:RRM domain-containing protein n=1 Tax=Picea sitchensis TaxID=3332 RepID=A9NYT6_PICSI|nr:unknown [Picea sitchensis]
MSHFGRFGPPDIRDTYSLLVLNITFRTSADDLFPLFDRYGKVVDIFIPRDKRTGDSRGFAFVRYKYADEAQKAIDRLDGRNVDGRNIMVQFAKYGPNAEATQRGRVTAENSKRTLRSRSRSPRSSRRYHDDYEDRNYRRVDDHRDRDYRRGDDRDRDYRRRRSSRDSYESDRNRERYRSQRRYSPSPSRSRSASRSKLHDEGRRTSRSRSFESPRLPARVSSPLPQIHSQSPLPGRSPGVAIQSPKARTQSADSRSQSPENRRKPANSRSRSQESRSRSRDSRSRSRDSRSRSADSHSQS